MARHRFTLEERKIGTLKAITKLKARRDVRSRRLGAGLERAARRKGWI